MKSPLGLGRNPFELKSAGLLDRAYRRYRFRAGYSRLRLAPSLDRKQAGMVDELRREGTLILPSYLSPAVTAALQRETQRALDALEFETPCLAQSRVDPQKHQSLINNYLYGSNRDFARQGVAFDRREVQSLAQVVRDFNPSTLTVYPLESSEAFRTVWLDPYLLTIVAHYLGLVPSLVEAYARRNFPARFWTMNHFWHRDLNDRHQLVKMFVFLSDCTIETGPHEYIRRSHRELKNFNGKRYFTDAEIDAQHPVGSPLREVSEVTAGTVILEDTRGLHRARMPDVGYRDLGYAVFFPLPPRAIPALYRFPRQSAARLDAFQRSFIPEACLA
jgi:hypothetical protein